MGDEYYSWNEDVKTQIELQKIGQMKIMRVTCRELERVKIDKCAVHDDENAGKNSPIVTDEAKSSKLADNSIKCFVLCRILSSLPPQQTLGYELSLTTSN